MRKIIVSEAQAVRLMGRLMAEQFESSEEIVGLQQGLNKYFEKMEVAYKIPEDGKISPKLEEALLYFQQREGVRDSGPYGEKTLEKLSGEKYLKANLKEKLVKILPR
jgi:hypothetical protein